MIRCFPKNRAISISYKLEIVNPLAPSDWDEWVLQSKQYSFFHSASWGKTLCDSYHYRPLYFVLWDSHEPAALMPVIEVRSPVTGRRGVSLPFSDFCPPIYSRQVACTRLLDEIFKVGSRCSWKYFEIRGDDIRYPDATPATRYYSHSIALSRDLDKMWSNFRDSTRRNIKKAQRQDVECRIERSHAAIKAFYRLNCLTRKRHHLPPQPFHFFENIYKYLIEKKHGIVVLASYRGAFISGAVYLHIGDKAIYKYGASDLAFQHLRANNLVMWQAIKWYAQKGYKNLNLGRTEPDNPGLMQFKNGWGGQRNQIFYYRYDFIQKRFINDHQQVPTNIGRLFAAMPVFLLRIFGRIAYRHIG